MATVLPAVTFTIPSLHDRVELECRLYRPAGSTGIASKRAIGKDDDERILGAVIAHPYANLGGCFDDPAVLAATGELLQQGYTVGTFNFRGAGNSKGSTSWTGLPELADYVSFTGCFINLLRHLGLDSDSSPAPSPSIPEASLSPLSPTPEFRGPGLPVARISLVLSGYSYGSRILTHLPSVSSIVRRFAKPAAGSVEAIIVDTARCIAEREKANGQSGLEAGEDGKDEASPRRSHHSVHVGGNDGDSTSPSGKHQQLHKRLGSLGSLRGRHHHRHRSSDVDKSALDDANDDGAGVDVDLRFLVISPVLPPAGWLTSPRLHRPDPGPSVNLGAGPGEDSTASVATPATATVTMNVADADMDVRDTWADYPSLVVYGDEDQFTSAAKIRRWIERAGGGAGAGAGADGQHTRHVTGVEIQRQGHFWHTREAASQLTGAVRLWLQKSPEGRKLL